MDFHTQDIETYKKQTSEQIQKFGRQDKRQNNEIRSFVVYEIPKVNSNARCFYESESNKFICSIYGPQHPKGLNIKFECSIEITIEFLNDQKQNEEKIAHLEQQLKNTLTQMIITNEYQKSYIEISFQVIENNGSVFPCLINLAFITLSRAGIHLYDTYSACNCAYIGDILIAEPTEEEKQASRNELQLVQGKNSGQLIYFHQSGVIGVEELEKMCSLGLSCTQILKNYLCDKLRTFDN